MGVTSWIRRQFKNGVSISDYIPAGMSNVATSFTAHDGTTFPDGSAGNFIVTVDQFLTTEERILCSARSGAVFTVASGGRGYNGTTAQIHGTNAPILHTSDAQDFDEANQVAVQTLGAITAQGDLLVGSSANNLVKLAKGANGTFLQAGASTLGYTAFGSGGTTGIAAAGADGTSINPARYDHTHAGLGQPLGLTGAVTPTRYVGATAGGAPGSGTFVAGDFIVDTTGKMFVCTVGGSPGTWVNVFTPGNADYLAVASGGLTGATANTRYVGGTASGPPTSGTFNVGDMVVDRTGLIWLCTTFGTPGTWQLITGQAAMGGNVVATGESSAATAYGNLTTTGPTVTLVTGTAVKVTLTALITNGSASNNFMGFAVSGATTLAASDNTALEAWQNGAGVGQQATASAVFYLATLTAGSNTFTAKYRCSAGTGGWQNRNLIVERMN
jgi:hypothetical protein